MSRTQEFKDMMIEEKNNNPLLEPLQETDSTSKVSRWNLYLYVVAFMANTMWDLWLVLKSELDFLVKSQRHVNIDFLREKLLNYRYGHPFDKEALEFTGTYTDDEILAAQIVKRAAVQAIQLENRKLLNMLIATVNANGELERIEQNKVDAILPYIEAHGEGTQIRLQSLDADDLWLEVDVYIDNQILTIEGERIDGSVAAPVPAAIHEFLGDKNFKFDGELILSLLEDKIQQVEGVDNRAVKIKLAKANYQQPIVWQDIDERYIAQSGYYKLTEDNLKINYIIP